MLKLYFLVLKNIHFNTKMLQPASYIQIYADNCIFLLEMAAILENGRHFEFLHGLRVGNKVYALTKVHVNFMLASLNA